MPLPDRVENGYRGVEIRQTNKFGFYVVRLSHNVRRFDQLAEARAFVDEMIEADKAQTSEFFRRFKTAA